MDDKIDEILYMAPPTNRGVVCTYKSGLSLLFDWVQATIFPLEENYDIYSIFFRLFGITRDKVLFNAYSPHFGYDYCYSFRHLMIFGSDSRKDMGVHIYLTGTGCRDLEDLGISYDDFFNKIISMNGHFTRIDLSFDDFTGKYFPLKKINNCIKANEVICKFRSSIQFTKDDLISVDNIGHTIWFGSRSSNVQFVFYDKLKERKCNDVEIIDEIKYWNRFEMRFKNDYAFEIVYNFLNLKDFNSYIFALINNYISFRITNNNDSNRRRWQYQKWWNDFLCTSDKVRFQTRPIEYDITKKNNWLMKSVSYSSFCVLLSDIKDFTSDTMLSAYLYKLFKKGSENLSEKHLELINQYRLKNNLQPIEYDEVKDFVKNVKEFVINKCDYEENA